MRNNNILYKYYMADGMKSKIAFLKNPVMGVENEKKSDNEWLFFFQVKEKEEIEIESSL